MIGLPGAETAPRLGAPPPRSLRRRSDERLVRIARDGDERAFELLFERHRPAILRYCRSLLRAPQEAEDVGQEVFVQAISALRRGAEPRSFRPWLYRIAHNACVSHLRARRPVLVGDDGALTGPGAAVEPADGHREELRQLLDDIRLLPEIQRGALLLCEMDGFSYAQVGDVLGVPQSTVRASIFRARRTLQGLAEARDADCREIQSELCELADRRGRRNRRITAHLRVCPSCRSFRDALRRRPAILGVTPSAAPAVVPVGPIGVAIALKAKLLGGASAGATAAAAGGGGGAAKVASLASTCALLTAGGLEAERALDAGGRDRPVAARDAGAMPHREGPRARQGAAPLAAGSPASVAIPTTARIAPGAGAAPPGAGATGTHRRQASDTADERPARRGPRPVGALSSGAPAPPAAAAPAAGAHDDEADRREAHADRTALRPQGEPPDDGRDDGDDRKVHATTQASEDEARSETPASPGSAGGPAAPPDGADEDSDDGPPVGAVSPQPTATAASATDSSENQPPADPAAGEDDEPTPVEAAPSEDPAGPAPDNLADGVPPR